MINWRYHYKSAQVFVGADQRSLRSKFMHSTGTR